jgi:O-antigen ligase
MWFISTVGPRRLVISLVGVAGALAILAIAFKQLENGKIYGFWQPNTPGLSFGSFVNRNHFAGYMIMAFGLAAGLVGDLTANLRVPRRPSARDWLVWAGEPAAGRLLLALFACWTIACAILLSLSRSGAVGLLVALAFFLLIGVRSAGRRRTALVASLAVAVVLAITVGAAGVGLRFTDLSGSPDIEYRLGIWRDTLRIASDFPLAGVGINGYKIATLLYPMSERTSHWSAAHNDYLQLIAEGGALLVITVGTALTWLFRNLRVLRAMHIDRPSPWVALGASAGLVGILWQEAVDFSLQLPGNAALFAISAAIALHASLPTRKTARNTSERFETS